MPYLIRHLTRYISFRKMLAGFALATAIFFAVVDAYKPQHGYSHVVSAATEIPAHKVISAEDLRAIELPSELLPQNAFTKKEDLVGKTVAGPIESGEIIVGKRLVGTSLSNALTGEPDSRIVAVTPDNQGIVSILAIGDSVDVIAAEDSSHNAAPIVRSARIASTGDAKAKEKTVFLTLPAGSAEIVASSGINTPLALVLAGSST